MVDSNLLIDVVTVARRPVPLRVCAAALDASEDDVIEAASSLVAEGTLLESADGYAVPDGTPEPSPVRSARAARVLAKGLIATDSDPEWIGSSLAHSDTPDEAIPYLVKAADELAAQGRVTEAMNPAGKVLEFGSGVDRQTEGRMHLVRGQGRRFTGDSEGASDDFEDAAARLDGEPRIDALGFAASGASDLQQPQRAERLLATAAAESIAEFPAKLGSLCALWAREVSRLGFPDEAEALLDKSDALLDEHGSAFQRYLAKWNRAWIYVDRGDYRRAEADLDFLVYTAEDGDHAASDIAEKKAYHGRALFGMGKPQAALERLREAATDATPSIRYLVALAESEGHPRYGAWTEALEATDRLSESVEELVPAWRNVGLYLRAKALAGSGQLDEARRTVAEAILACPPGVNGWRWRQRCRALQMDLAARAGEPFPAEEAEGLVEEMLRAQWLGPAAELLVAMARHTKTPDRARQAMALAWKGGDVMLAAEAAEVAGAWESELASPIVDRVRRIEGELDESMAASLRELPHAATALAVQRDVSEDETALRAEFEEAITAVLGDDPTLTPAQRRRAKTLAARRRRRSFLTGFGSVAVVAIGVVAVLALLGTFNGGDGGDDGPLPPTTTTTTTTTLPAMIPIPDGGLFGFAPHRGGPARTAIFDSDGVPDGGLPASDPIAKYWEFPTTGNRPTAHIVIGNNVYLGSDRTLFAIRIDGPTSSFFLDADASMTSPPASGELVVAAETGERRADFVVIGSEDGNVNAVDLGSVGSWAWQFATDGAVRAAPLIVEGLVLAASEDGHIYAINADGQQEWKYPDDESEIVAGAFSGGVAQYSDGIYAADEGGTVHYVGLDGQPRCTGELPTGSTVNPVVTDEFVYFSAGVGIVARSVGLCGGLVDTVQPQNDSAITSSPVVTDEYLYMANGRLLVASPLGTFEALTQLPSEPVEDQRVRLTFDSGEFRSGYYRYSDEEWVRTDWSVSAEEPIVGGAVLAGDVLYFADTGGYVFAVDASTGQERWRYSIGVARILEAPVVIDNAVIVVNDRGVIYAIGARP